MRGQPPKPGTSSIGVSSPLKPEVAESQGFPRGVLVLLFALAFALRLFFLVFVSGFEYAGWYQDSFHHWQIAYYTLHIGLAQNPSRMWDLGGMEYFWGLFPTLIESFLLWVFNTASLLPFRVFNIIMGSVSTCLIYLVGRKYFGARVGLISGLLIATSPIFFEIDTSGMLEPTGFSLMLAALLLYEKRTYWSGFLLALASLCHVLFWFVAIASIGSHLIFGRSRVRFVRSLLGWFTPMVPYFWFMQTRTGDWLYALRWNFFGNVAGGWISDIKLPLEAQIIPRALAVVPLVAALTALLLLLKKKPKSYPLHVLFLTFIVIQGAIYGLSAYVVPYIAMGQLGRLILDRLFAPDYYYLALLVGIGVVRLLKNSAFMSPQTGRPRLKLVTVVVLVLILANFATYPYVMGQYFLPTYHVPIVSQTMLAQEILSGYTGGTIVTGLPIVTYHLINAGIPYRNVLGSLYAPSGDRIEGYRWLIKENVTCIISDKNIGPIVQDGLKDAVILPTTSPGVFSVNQTALRLIVP